MEKVLDALQEQQQDPSVDSGAPNCHVRADTVICLDSVTEGEKKRADGLGVKLIGWADVIKAVSVRKCGDFAQVAELFFDVRGIIAGFTCAAGGGDCSSDR